jgi:2-oxoisovalerate dehydrogenase E1 component
MVEFTDTHFLANVGKGDSAVPPGGLRSLTSEQCLALFDAQLASRHLDLAARWLREQGKGYYTIGSSGHEGNAALAAALLPTDPALLHYRSGAFFVARAQQAGYKDAVRDVLLGVVAAASEPIAGGRHKVIGSKVLNVIPGTSTIASHLPRAVGVAFSIDRAAKLGLPCEWPRDAITVCSFGDASANHSTATGAINAAIHSGFQGLPLPLLFVCEDNGIGISVPTPSGWVRNAYGARPGLEYFWADGTDVAATHEAAVAAAAWVRLRRRPAFLHLSMVRLMGHAGSDVESAYRTTSELVADQARDPLLATARLLVANGSATSGEVIELYEAKRREVMAVAAEVADESRLRSAQEIMAPLADPRPPVVAPRRVGGRPLTVAQAINQELADLLAEHRELLVFGEDVGRKGGVYGVTRGLLKSVGAARVFDTLLDEQSILGLALGAGLSGLLPVPEIQYLAYLHNAADQIRGEAATMSFFSNGRYRNPMVVRIASYAYQKGFGGHFHNDNAVSALRDIPGLVIASPARPDDAAGMLRTCVAAAKDSGRVCVFLEPIALYHTRDLHSEGDNGWLAAQPAEAVPLGRARAYGTGEDLLIVTFGNGLRMSLRVARRLAEEGIQARVLDLRWLAPLPVDDLLSEAAATGRVLIVDETRRSGGVSEGVLAALNDAGFGGVVTRVTSEDSFIPLGDAADLVLLSESAISAGAMAVAAVRRTT